MFQVHVWAGISRRGATRIAIFTGFMNSEGYQQILDQYLPPFVRDEYPAGHRLWQDNDPKHVSKATVAWMAQNDVNHWPTPPESPDINPIERVWAALKYYIGRRVKPLNKGELTQGIRDFWNTVDKTMCNNCINHTPEAARLITLYKGGPAGH